MWRDLAKIAEKYVHKGDKLYIEGRIRYRYYDDKKGQRRFVTEIYAENMEMLTSRQNMTQTTASTTTNANTGSNQTAAANQPNSKPTVKSAEEDNDALPF